MGRDTYPVPLSAVSSDIKKVGGQDAYLGMLREGTDGKRYVLVQYSTGTIAANATKLILGFDGGEAFKVILAFSGQRCNGVPATDLAIATGDYFWMQNYGVCNNVLAPGATKGAEIGSVGSGVGGKLTLKTSVVDDAVTTYTLALTGSVGWSMSDAASNLISVFIDPKFVWTGTGAPVSFEAGGDDE